jgi:hypothetical protein
MSFTNVVAGGSEAAGDPGTAAAQGIQRLARNVMKLQETLGPQGAVQLQQALEKSGLRAAQSGAAQQAAAQSVGGAGPTRGYVVPMARDTVENQSAGTESHGGRDAAQAGNVLPWMRPKATQRATSTARDPNREFRRNMADLERMLPELYAESDAPPRGTRMRTLANAA